MMHRAPVPAFPAGWAEAHLCRADQVVEAEQRGEPVIDVAPLLVGRVEGCDGAGSVLGLHAPDFAGDEVQRFIPANADISGLAAVLSIAFSVGVEVYPLHRVEDALVR